MSELKGHLESRPCEVELTQVGAATGDFPSDILRIGLRGTATNHLILFLVGNQESFENPRKVLRQTTSFINNLEELEAPKVPVLTDAGDVKKLTLEPNITIRRVLPDSTDFDGVTGASIDDAHLFAQKVSEKYDGGEDLGIDILPENDGVHKISVLMKFGVHKITSHVPIFSSTPSDTRLRAAYESVHFPVAILTEDEDMKDRHTRSRCTNVTVHPFQLPSE